MGRPAEPTKVVMKKWRAAKAAGIEDASFIDRIDGWDMIALSQRKVRTGAVERFIEEHFSKHIPRKVNRALQLTDCHLYQFLHER